VILGRGARLAERRLSARTRLLLEKLKEAIVRGKLSPGEALNEPQLAASFKVAPVALREALRVLDTEGYVTFRSDNEVVVSKPSREEIENYYAIAGALEGLAARLAVERARPDEIERLRELHQELKQACQKRDVIGYYKTNGEFHRAIADVARNERLYRLIDQLRQELQKTLILSLRVPQRLEHSMREHDQILDAFVKKNPELAAAAMARHLNNQMEILKNAGDAPKGGQS